MKQKQPQTALDLLRDEIDAAGLKQYQAAALIGIPQSTLSDYMHGRTPTKDHVLLIAAAFKRVTVASWGGKP